MPRLLERIVVVTSMEKVELHSLSIGETSNRLFCNATVQTNPCRVTRPDKDVDLFTAFDCRMGAHVCV